MPKRFTFKPHQLFVTTNGANMLVMSDDKLKSAIAQELRYTFRYVCPCIIKTCDSIASNRIDDLYAKFFSGAGIASGLNLTAGKYSSLGHRSKFPAAAIRFRIYGLFSIASRYVVVKLSRLNRVSL